MGVTVDDINYPYMAPVNSILQAITNEFRQIVQHTADKGDNRGCLLGVKSSPFVAGSFYYNNLAFLSLKEALTDAILGEIPSTIQILHKCISLHPLYSLNQDKFHFRVHFSQGYIYHSKDLLDWPDDTYNVQPPVARYDIVNHESSVWNVSNFHFPSSAGRHLIESKYKVITPERMPYIARITKIDLSGCELEIDAKFSSRFKESSNSLQSTLISREYLATILKHNSLLFSDSDPTDFYVGEDYLVVVHCNTGTDTTPHSKDDWYFQLDIFNYVPEGFYRKFPILLEFL